MQWIRKSFCYLRYRILHYLEEKPLLFFFVCVVHLYNSDISYAGEYADHSSMFICNGMLFFCLWVT